MVISWTTHILCVCKRLSEGLLFFIVSINLETKNRPKKCRWSLQMAHLKWSTKPHPYLVWNYIFESKKDATQQNLCHFWFRKMSWSAIVLAWEAQAQIFIKFHLLCSLIFVWKFNCKPFSSMQHMMQQTDKWFRLIFDMRHKCFTFLFTSILGRVDWSWGEAITSESNQFQSLWNESRYFCCDQPISIYRMAKEFVRKVISHFELFIEWNWPKRRIP